MVLAVIVNAWSFPCVTDIVPAGVIKPFDIFCISNNQRGNSMIRQNLDKMLGVTKGVADYCVLGIGYLEAKRIQRINKDGRVVPTGQQPEQIDFEIACAARGQKYATFYTPEMGIDILLAWLKEKRSFIPATEFLKRVDVIPV